MNYFIGIEFYSKIEKEIERFIDETNPKPNGEEAFKVVDTVISNLFTDEEFKHIENMIQLESEQLYLIVTNDSLINITSSMKYSSINDEIKWSSDKGYKIFFKIKYLPKGVYQLPDLYTKKLNEYINNSLDNPVKKYILDSISWIKKIRSLRRKYKFRRKARLNEESKIIQNFVLSEFKIELDQYYNKYFKLYCNVLDIPYYEPKAKFKSCVIDSTVNKTTANKLNMYLSREYDKYYYPLKDWIDNKIYNVFSPKQYRLLTKLQYLYRYSRSFFISKGEDGTILFKNWYGDLNNNNETGFFLKINIDDVYTPTGFVSEYVIDHMNKMLEIDPNRDKLIHDIKKLLMIRNSLINIDYLLGSYEHTDEIPDIFKSIIYHLYKRNKDNNRVSKDLFDLIEV